MVVDPESGECVTARTQPRLVLVTPTFASDTSELLINAPGMETLVINMAEIGTKTVLSAK